MLDYERLSRLTRTVEEITNVASVSHINNVDMTLNYSAQLFISTVAIAGGATVFNIFAKNKV